MCNSDLTLKSEYMHLSELNLIKYMFYIDLVNHEWTITILSRVHDEMFWICDVPIIIENDLIHKVIGMISEGYNSMNDRNMRNIFKTNLYTRFDGRNMKVDMIYDIGVKVLIKMLGYKLNHSSRVNLVLVGFMHVAYVMVIEIRKVNMCEIVRIYLLDNIAKIKKTKNVVFRFESLLTNILFCATNKFPKMKNWDNDDSTMNMLTQYYKVRLENVKDSDIDRVMKKFQSKMKQRFRIAPFMVEKYKDEI